MIPGGENDVLSPLALRSALRRAELSPRMITGITTRFLVVIEPTASGFSSYAPDLVGCVSTGKSVEDVEASMRDAINGHLEELRNAGSPIPSPSVSVRYIDVTV
jgi:predicted RNase H-like HicB family nuclease